MIDAVRKYCDNEEISEQTRLDELGLDSLDFLDMAVELGLKPEALADAVTVGDLLEAAVSD